MSLQRTKQYAISRFKTPSDDSGEFEALVSVFGNVDLQGDRVMPGAFSKSLKRWRESGDPVPVVFSHEWNDAWAHIGSADPENIKETSDGLLVRGTLDIDSNPLAAQVFRLMKRRTMKEFSFSYEIKKEKLASDSANNLVELDLIEVGPTLKGANPETELVSIKAALDAAIEADGEKAGRTISKANENKIRGAITTLEEVLKSIAAESGVEDAKSDDNPENAKAEETAEETPAPAEEPVEEVDLVAGITADIELMRTRFALGRR
jgi:uncharacterized protein